MNVLSQALLMARSGLDSSIIFWAPLNTSTGSLDITANPLAATVYEPAGSTITYTGDGAIFNSFGVPGEQAPTLSWGSINTGLTTKLYPALYPTQTIQLSTRAEALEIYGGQGGSAQDITFLRFAWDSSGFVAWGWFGSSLMISYGLGGGSASSSFVESPPPAGENLYSIEWTPGGVVSFKLNGDTIRTVIISRENPSRAMIENQPTYYGGTYYPGVYEASVRDTQYRVGPQMYAWSTTGFSNSELVWSNNDRTVTWNCPSSQSGIFRYSQSMQPLSGKVYCEFDCTSSAGNIFNAFGVQSSTTNAFLSSNGVSVYSYSTPGGGCGLPEAGLNINGGWDFNSAYYFVYGDRIGIAFDVSTKKIWFSKNGTWITGDPAAGTGESSTLTTSGPFYFTWGNYTCYAPAGDYSYTIYPDAATQTYSPPAGFVRYQA